MAMFHFDTAFMLEAIAFAAGLALLHFGKAGAAVLLRTAGWVLVVTALGTAACSIYYGIRYHVQGGFDYAYGPCPGAAHPMVGPPGAMMMRHPGPTMEGAQRRRMAPPEEAEPEVSPAPAPQEPESAPPED
jgi:hypothetical protein